MGGGWSNGDEAYIGTGCRTVIDIYGLSKSLMVTIRRVLILCKYGDC
jgi:hypothetical protein